MLTFMDDLQMNEIRVIKASDMLHFIHALQLPLKDTSITSLLCLFIEIC